MIIDIQGVPLVVEYGFEDDEIYIDTVSLHGYDVTEIIGQDWLDVILDTVIASIEEDNEEAKFENAIDDCQNRWVEL
jgi:hypothetical protein